MSSAWTVAPVVDWPLATTVLAERPSGAVAFAVKTHVSPGSSLPLLFASPET